MPRPKPEKKPRRGQRDLSAAVHERRWEVGAPDHGGRLDRFLAARIDWRSRTGIQALIRDGAVAVVPHKDPQQAEVGAIREGLKLRAGQEVVLSIEQPGGRSDEERSVDGEMPPEAAALQAVYEDEHLIAVNKPPHLSVHPSRGHLTGSLIHYIHERHRHLHGTTDDMPTLCHRLDRETTGLVLCAKDLLSRSRLGRQFEARTVNKWYLALVEGDVPGEEGTIDAPLGKALASEVRLKMTVRHDDDGMPSVTHWKVRRRLGGRTLLELKPETGRQHQLRVHLAALGHPIIGDKLYFGGDEMFVRSVSGELEAADLEQLGLDHQALHSWKLEVEHPFTGRRLLLEAPLWPDVAALAGEDKTGD